MRHQGTHVPVPASTIGSQHLPHPGTAFAEQSSAACACGLVEKLAKAGTRLRSNPAGADQATRQAISHAPPPVGQVSNLPVFSGRLETCPTSNSMRSPFER